MVANNICDDFLKKLGEIQNMSLAGEKATQFANCEQFSSFYGVWITELKELGVEQISMWVCPKFCVNTEMQCKIEPK